MNIGMDIPAPYKAVNQNGGATVGFSRRTQQHGIKELTSYSHIYAQKITESHNAMTSSGPPLMNLFLCLPHTFSQSGAI